MNPFNVFLALDISTANYLVLSLVTPTQTFVHSTHSCHLESELIPSINQLLSEANYSLGQLDAFVLGAGPGSFMGLRIGFSVIRMLSWTFDIPVTIVSSLILLTFSHFLDCPNTLIVSCIDGKMNRVFANIMLNNQIILHDNDLFPEVIAQKIQTLNTNNDYPIIILGSGSELLAPFFSENTKISYYSHYKIEPSVFTLSFLQKIPTNQFYKKSQDQLVHIIPNYLRLSAAEMTLKNSQ